MHVRNCLDVINNVSARDLWDRMGFPWSGSNYQYCDHRLALIKQMDLWTCMIGI